MKSSIWPWRATLPRKGEDSFLYSLISKISPQCNIANGNQRNESKVWFVFQIEAIWKGQILARYLEVRVQNSSLPVCLLLPETPMPTSRHKGQWNLKSVDAQARDSRAGDQGVRLSCLDLLKVTLNIRRFHQILRSNKSFHNSYHSLPINLISRF